AAILMNPKVWEASGHLNNFNDPMIDNKDSKIRYRADKLIEDYMQDVKGDENFIADGLSFEQMKKIIDDEGIVCPVSKTANWTEIRQFNLMFKTFQGVTEDSTNEIFLRPETAQGIFVNYKNVQRSMRKKLPFGIGQIGKSFRNEITPGNFIFRTREFEQMELEFFCKPG
ncbi:glycine--tRNA ligase, partial [Staphylococcus aureus]|nr:glycine--tRNA ligase [Staphylococcus aureus]